MKIYDIETGEVYYKSKGVGNFIITKEFWKYLKTKKVKYRVGGVTKDGTRFTTVSILNLADENFESIFIRVAKSEMGKLVMKGELPVDTIL